MSRSNQLLSKRRFDAKIKKLRAGRDYLDNTGSDISGIMPGWLGLIEHSLNSVDELSNGTVNFFLAQVRETSFDNNRLVIFLDSSLPDSSGRVIAIKTELEHIMANCRSVCRYCGVELNENAQTGVCNLHSNIKSGRFAEDIKLKDKASKPLSVEPDEVTELAIRVIDSLRGSHNKNVSEIMEECTRFFLRVNLNAVEREVFDSKKEELAGKLDAALMAEIAERNPAVVKVPVNSSGQVHPHLQLYKAKDLEDMWLRAQQKDRKASVEHYYNKMKALGTTRTFALIPDGWREMLNDLAEDFPNMIEVVDYLRQQFALSERGDARFQLGGGGILLDGPSGVGKTMLVKTFAEMMNCPYCEIHMESEQSSAKIAGSSSFWSNATPGVIAESLCIHDSSSASAVILVDEVDKAAKISQYDPLAGLYALLENGTNTAFTDMCLGFPINTSGLSWFLTSNDSSKLEAPILSRLKVFKVRAPTAEQTIHIAHRIYASLLKSHWGKSFQEELPAEVAETLGRRPPREIKGTLLSALGNAALDERDHLTIGDLGGMPKVLSGDAYQRSRIGFQKELR